MPTAQEILDSFLGINDYTINTKETEFNRDNMTAIIKINTMENIGTICDSVSENMITSARICLKTAHFRLVYVNVIW